MLDSFNKKMLNLVSTILNGLSTIQFIYSTHVLNEKNIGRKKMVNIGLINK
jgi:hypothetical protein